MPREVRYESPKRGAGTPLRSEWIAADDDRSRTHLEGKGWRIVETREKPVAVPRVPPLPLPGEKPSPPGLLLTDTPPPAAAEEQITEPEFSPEQVVILAEMLDLTETQTDALIAAGYNTADKLRAAADDQLRAIDGIGPAAVRNIRKALAAP